MKRGMTAALGALLAVLAVAAPASAAKQGGTFKGMFATDVDFVDPSLAYYAHSMRIQNAIGANLVRFADAEGSAGSRLVPEVAGFPLVSADGRTYTFRIRKGFRFSNGKPVTARNFAWAINRALTAAAGLAGRDVPLRRRRRAGGARRQGVVGLRRARRSAAARRCGSR